jgi:hypothetical protein
MVAITFPIWDFRKQSLHRNEYAEPPLCAMSRHPINRGHPFINWGFSFFPIWDYPRSSAAKGFWFFKAISLLLFRSPDHPISRSPLGVIRIYQWYPSISGEILLFKSALIRVDPR